MPTTKIVPDCGGYKKKGEEKNSWRWGILHVDGDEFVTCGRTTKK